eukprot:2135723-Rhodomonas_salina.1
MVRLAPSVLSRASLHSLLFDSTPPSLPQPQPTPTPAISFRFRLSVPTFGANLPGSVAQPLFTTRQSGARPPPTRRTLLVPVTTRVP